MRNISIKYSHILRSSWARIFSNNFQKILDVNSNMRKAFVCCSIVGSRLTKIENSLNWNGLNLIFFLNRIDLFHICYEFSHLVVNIIH